MIHILLAIGGGFAALFTRIEIACKRQNKLTALARILHPKECEKLHI